jgi:hypothetical protein
MKTRIKRMAVLMAAAALLSMPAATPAQAYMVYQCTFAGDTDTLHWDGPSFSWRFSEVSFPEGTTRANQLDLARRRWNNSPGRFTFTNTIYGDGHLSRKNGESEAWFTEDYDILGGDTVTAKAFFRYYCNTGRIFEADIVFAAQPNREAPDVVWSYTDTKNTKTRYGGKGVTFGAVATHEMGHSFGLFHENREYNVMGHSTGHLTANDGRVRFYPGEDAADGQVAIYGNKNNDVPDDAGVSHWKYQGASGEYSAHERGRILNQSGKGVLNRHGFDGEERWEVFKGVTVRPEFTFENNGQNTLQNVSVGFYLSTNGRITTLDRLIGTHTFDTIQRGNAATLTLPVTIPADLNTGDTYWLGVVVDRLGQIEEFSEDNNAAYYPIQIK